MKVWRKWLRKERNCIKTLTKNKMLYYISIYYGTFLILLRSKSLNCKYHDYYIWFKSKDAYRTWCSFTQIFIATNFAAKFCNSLWYERDNQSIQWWNAFNDCSSILRLILYKCHINCDSFLKIIKHIWNIHFLKELQLKVF